MFETGKNKRHKRMAERSPEGLERLKRQQSATIKISVAVTIAALIVIAFMAVRYARVQSCLNGDWQHFASDQCSEVLK